MTAYGKHNDAALLVLLSRGDDKAFTEIYNRYWDKMLFVAGIKCRDLGIAEEIVQDIFLDLWRRRSELSVTGELEAYLAVSVKYRVINAQAKMKRALRYRSEAIGNSPEQVNPTEQWLSFQELKVRLSELVNKLPEKCRITYQLSKEEGLSQKEIAFRMNVSEKSVEANLARAMKSLRLNLKRFLFVFFSFFL
jgi:RNA polymerase sigma-70 factor (ECF subfamily)